MATRAIPEHEYEVLLEPVHQAIERLEAAPNVGGLVETAAAAVDALRQLLFAREALIDKLTALADEAWKAGDVEPLPAGAVLEAFGDAASELADYVATAGKSSGQVDRLWIDEVCRRTARVLSVGEGAQTIRTRNA